MTAGYIHDEQKVGEHQEGDPLQARRTMTAVSATPYEQHRGYVLAVLARRCGWLDASEREEILHDAYAVFLEKQRDGQLDRDAMRPQQVRAYLTQTALNKALDEGKRARRRTSVELDEGLEVAAGEPTADELLSESWDGARLREIVAELPERQQAIVKLRFFFDRTPEEIQRYLGVTERVYRRELERAMRLVATRFELVREGTFCESRRSLILAFVAGIAGPNRTADARRHLASCSGCARWAVELHENARQVGAAVPIPVLAVHLSGRGEWLATAGRTLDGMRERVAELLGGARDAATSAMVRADPASGSLLAGARPGAVVAVAAGCLTLGSTATYCAVEGIPRPLRALVGAAPESTRAAERPAPRRAAASSSAARTAPAALAPAPGWARPAAKPARTTPQALAPSGRPQPTTRRPAQPRATQAERRQAAAKRQERATSSEFGVEGGGTAGGGGTSGGTGGGSTPPAASSGSSGAPPASSGGSGGTGSTGGGSGSGTPSGEGGRWGSEFGP
ncbi:RNA polymerase sigma factor [Conexibacter woesei]|uniref:RNA polymerase, sigma-24 subunit, ECF subfamily n=1 Tax=Conexibacter woesei (strain DSM 14684 / CCUG 47730 / CIP 108061 / JCM 11494 / NBRC 100937 / ID131577) TaxID=469383 RepID=D3EYZ3_CONWI|nr:sigma-70 family RNA polymerase sigma factor [Conexibacter woesei]ADB49867.1 RNA polymerase, sigma-24 subunit, ECF subfamily [Conexibacter woesei DSM 14684]